MCVSCRCFAVFLLGFLLSCIVQKKEEWGPPGNSAGWGDPRSADPRAAMDQRDMRTDPRDIRAGSTDPMRLLDPRDQMRLVGGDMRGDPRGEFINSICSCHHIIKNLCVDVVSNITFRDTFLSML